MILILLALFSGAVAPNTVVDCRIDGGMLEALCAVTALHHGSIAIVDGTCDSGVHLPVLLRVDKNTGRVRAEPHGSCE